MKRLLVIIALIAATATPFAAVAQDAGPPAAVGRQAPLSRVLHEIAARYPGRHLNTSMGEQGGRAAYFVQWQMADGRVVVFVVDAESGQVIGRQGG